MLFGSATLHVKRSDPESEHIREAQNGAVRMSLQAASHALWTSTRPGPRHLLCCRVSQEYCGPHFPWTHPKTQCQA